MIMLTRLSGSSFVLNSDLIERIDSTPDTVLSLMDGKKYVVAEPVAEVVARVRTYRSEIVAQSSLLATGASAAEEPSSRLATVRPFPGTALHHPSSQATPHAAVPPSHEDA